MEPSKKWSRFLDLLEPAVIASCLFILLTAILICLWEINVHGANIKYSSIYSFSDERAVSEINSNFAKVTNNMIMDRGYNVAVVEASSKTVIPLNIVQDDTIYSVMVTPSWDTRIRVLQKTTTGFEVWSTTAPPGNTLDWIIVR